MCPHACDRLASRFARLPAKQFDMKRLSHFRPVATAMLLASACFVVAGAVAAMEARKIAAVDSPAEPRPGQTVTSINPLSGNPEAIDQGSTYFLRGAPNAMARMPPEASTAPT